jgi:hypothetical protein
MVINVYPFSMGKRRVSNFENNNNNNNNDNNNNNNYYYYYYAKG